jgi:hypothetical protein
VLHEPTTPTMAPPAASPEELTDDAPTALPENLPDPAPDPAPDSAPDSPPAVDRPLRPSPPSDLRPLARRARRDTVAARELASALLGRGWDVRRTATLAGLAESTVAALAHVRRPATAARAVAEDAAARARRRVAAGRRA